MTVGTELIAQERRRQIEEEEWTEDHDDEHEFNQLAWAAVCYAAPGPIWRDAPGVLGTTSEGSIGDPWPWESESDKRPRANGKLTDAYTTPAEKRIRALVKAGALIAAEIDRLTRMGA